MDSEEIRKKKTAELLAKAKNITAGLDFSLGNHTPLKDNVKNNTFLFFVQSVCVFDGYN